MSTKEKKEKVNNEIGKEFIKDLTELLLDEDKSKNDVLLEVKDMLDGDLELSNILGFIDDEDIRYEKAVDIFEGEIDYDGSESKKVDLGVKLNMLNVAKIDKSVVESLVSVPSKAEARYLQDIYYQMQEKRIVVESQLRAIKQGVDGDKEDTNNVSFLEYYYYNTKLMEEQIKKALEAFTDSFYISRWAKQVTGIGPVIATCLAANLELTVNEDGTDTDMHAGSWWAYCGLNDNNRPWIGKTEATKIVNEIVGDNKKITDEMVYALCAKSQWKFEHYEKNCKSKKGVWDKQKLINYTCIIPYNKSLKTLCYKIGHSFHMCKNKEKSLYGRLYKERFEYESIKNERGDYADQAASILAKKNIGKGTVAYKYYIEGKLPPAHITQRCERYVTKLFISHLFEAAYYNKFGRQCPRPYALLFMGHTDYIGPEVPYDIVERD